MKNPEDFVIPHLKKAFVKSVENFETEVKKRTPVDFGRLRNSIHISSLTTDGDTWEGEVGTDVEYAAWIEYGIRTDPRRGVVLMKNVKKGQENLRVWGGAAMFRTGAIAARQQLQRSIQQALRKGLQEYLKS